MEQVKCELKGGDEEEMLKPSSGYGAGLEGWRLGRRIVVGGAGKENVASQMDRRCRGGEKRKIMRFDTRNEILYTPRSWHCA